MPDYRIDFQNGYKIQTIFANKLPDGGHGDIYDFRSDAERAHPGAEILTGYCVIDVGLGLIPNRCKAWNDTLTDALTDYEEHIIPILEQEEDIELNDTELDADGKPIRETLFSVKSGWLQDYLGVDNKTQLEALLTNSDAWDPSEIRKDAQKESQYSGYQQGDTTVFSIQPTQNTYIKEIALQVRQELEEKYDDDLAGHCIEASETIVERLLSQLGLTAVTKAGWCRFDDDSYGSDRPWEAHTWVEVPDIRLYIDITADQFNYGMYREHQYPKILIREGLPHGMQYEEPSWLDYEEDYPNIDPTNVISVSDVVHTLCECQRNVRYDGMFEHMLTFASELTGISEDQLSIFMQQKAGKTEHFLSDIESPSSLDKRTKIKYLYCDADGNQVPNDCIIDGVFTSAQIALIINCLDDEIYFIPSLVGLPEKKFDEVDDPQLDHQWFILREDGFEETSERSTLYLTPSELVTAFCKCKNNWMDLYLGEDKRPSLEDHIRSARSQAGPLKPPPGMQRRMQESERD